MKHISTRIRDQASSQEKIILRPVVFTLQLTKFLSPCQSSFESLDSAGIVVPGFIEDGILLEKSKDVPFLLKVFFGEQEFG